MFKPSQKSPDAQTLPAVHESPTGDLTQAHADATAAITRAGAEVTRLSTLLQDASTAVTQAQLRAADAVAAPDAEAGPDEQIMRDVATTRARRDALSTALLRAKKVEADAKAALPPIERQRRRLEAEQTLSVLAPALADIDQGIMLLGRAIPFVEEQYNAGLYRLLETFTLPENASGPQPPPLVLEQRIRSELFKHLGRAPFIGAGSIINFTTPSLSVGVTALIDGFRAQLLESETRQLAQVPA